MSGTPRTPRTPRFHRLRCLMAAALAAATLAAAPVHATPERTLPGRLPIAGSAFAWIESAWDALSALWSAATGTSTPSGSDEIRRPSSGSTSTPNDGGSCIDPNGVPCA